MAEALASSLFPLRCPVVWVNIVLLGDNGLRSVVGFSAPSDRSSESGSPPPKAALGSVTSHVVLYRGLLALSGAAVLGLWLISPGRSFDPLLPRVVLSTLAFAGLVASFHPKVLPYSRQMVMGLAYLLLAWFLYVGRCRGFDTANMVGLMPIVIVVPALSRTLRSLVAFTVFLYLSILLAYLGVESPDLSLPVMLMLQMTMVLGLGGMSLARTRLETALADANRRLEERVSERTEALASINERLREEVRSRSEAELRAQEGSRAKSAFLANMSHELRTPLTAILGYSELLEEELDEPECAQEDIRRIQSSGRHLLHLIDDILDLARIEAMEIAFEMEDLLLAEVIEEAVQLVRSQLEEHGNSFHPLCLPSVRVRGDRIRLRQVFVNLLSNAAKFTSEGTITVSCEVGEEGVRVFVKDTGMGMAPAVVERIFERFVQVDDSYTRTHEGTGLGLSISRHLVEGMGGRLTAESVLGEGSTFTVKLLLPEAHPSLS